MKRTQWLPAILLGGFFMSLWACKSDTEKGVVGKWEAAQLKECDDIVPIQTALVSLELFSNGTYTFQSTLNVKEEGTYRIKKNYLYRTDKKAKTPVEKAVLIESLSADTLILAMNFKGKDQWLTLVREGAADRQVKRELAAEAEQMKMDSLAMVKEMQKNGGKLPDTPSVNAANAATLAAVSTPVVAATPVPEPKKEEPKKEETKPLTEREAYLKREEKRKEEEADRERERKKEREAYLKREAKRREEEADRERERKKEREAYLKREAKRKKEEAERKKKK